MSTRPPPPHGPGCRCSSCHLSSKLFPRGPNDRIILPAIRPGDPQSPYMGGNDRAHFAPPRPQSTAPHEYRPRHHDAPPMPMSPPMPSRYGAPPSGGSGSGSRRSLDQHAAPPPPPGHGHAHGSGHGHRRTMSTYGHGHGQAPPERPASAMATRSPAMSPHAPSPRRAHATPPDASGSNGQGQGQGQGQGDAQQGNLEWMPPRLKWVKKKERVSHFTAPSQYQGTSFRQYVHEGVVARRE
ncbi:hypothetical protein B0H16DRAFT_265629 [Mycena metata]|uniref:Uncharacterized protein n=1 Tax=Mycena metata TaxID=1033252 RepID=A0AAD7MP82_9AGAR|nr:hypothetical protein B0H16DRAFT_265629 [Mycena metata]